MLFLLFGVVMVAIDRRHLLRVVREPDAAPDGEPIRAAHTHHGWRRVLADHRVQGRVALLAWCASGLYVLLRPDVGGTVVDALRTYQTAWLVALLPCLTSASMSRRFIFGGLLLLIAAVLLAGSREWPLLIAPAGVAGVVGIALLWRDIRSLSRVDTAATTPLSTPANG